MAKNATFDQYLQFGHMVSADAISCELMQAILEGRVEIIEKPREQTGTPYRGGVPSGDVLPPHHYCITIESVRQPVVYAGLIANYGEGNVSELWNESKYQLNLHESLREIVAPTGEVTLFVKKFDRATTSEKAIKWADEHNYRLVFPWEREAFSKANPDLQRKFWIVDLGSFVVYDVYRCVPVLRQLGGKRSLDSYWFGYEWLAGYRFLFASK